MIVRQSPRAPLSTRVESDPPSAMFCEHANEVPQRCPCESGCYCKRNTCAVRVTRSAAKPLLLDPRSVD